MWKGKQQDNARVFETGKNSGDYDVFGSHYVDEREDLAERGFETFWYV